MTKEGMLTEKYDKKKGEATSAIPAPFRASTSCKALIFKDTAKLRRLQVPM